MLLEQPFAGVGGERSALGQSRRPLLSHRRLAVDGGVHLRLGEARLVPLVVAIAPIADEVDDEVGSELATVGARQAGDLDARLRIVGVDVDDGHFEPLGQIAGVERAAPFPLRGGEADLVVGDEMNGAADAIAAQPLQVERLGHDPLSGEGGVAVDDDRQDGLGVVVWPAGAIGTRAGGASHAGDDRVDVLQMAGVRGHRDDEIDRAAVG